MDNPCRECKNSDYAQKQADISYQQIETYLQDKEFLYVALNLSGHREELEVAATELIDKLGIHKAILKSRESE